MKRWSIFILILASSFGSFALACGFYPSGEFLRFCFLKPDFFADKSFSEFWYSADLFAPRNSILYDKPDADPNVRLWMAYCKGKASAQDVAALVYQLSAAEFQHDKKNGMLRQLQATKDVEAIGYLKFAKKCELFNAIYEDPWERSENVTLSKRDTLIQEAVAGLNRVKNPEMQLRYAFLAIRLAYYNGNDAQLRALYDRVYAFRDKRNILDYWSMYFRTYAEPDAARASFFAAQVFAHAPDKRFMTYGKFHSDANLQEVLSYAKTNPERANVYVLAATCTPHRALEYLQQVRQLDPENAGLDFLLLREVNKIEDWVFTPYYSLFEPSTSGAYYVDDTFISMPKILARVEKDRTYAQELLGFVDAQHPTPTAQPELWQAARAQLLFVTRQYDKALGQIRQLEANKTLNDSLQRQLRVLKALNLVAKQPSGKAVIPEAVKPIILENAHDRKFLFALGRELEYHGNTTDAALLYSRLSEPQNGYDDNVVWKTRRNKMASYGDYYADYFSYADAVYTIPQVESLIASVENNNAGDAFSSWLYAGIKTEVSRLYDLLGTKYFRQDNLPQALAAYQKTQPVYWSRYYTSWGNAESSSFDANPFFTLKYTPEFIAKKETFALNKATVTQKLLEYLAKANNPKERNRDYYYLLVGNAYANTTITGNSWMMRRFHFSAYDVDPFPEDEAEFRNGYLAQKYYRLAYKHAKSPQFKALCLRLAQDFKKLKREFPDDYDALTGGCEAFARYYEAREKR